MFSKSPKNSVSLIFSLRVFVVGYPSFSKCCRGLWLQLHEINRSDMIKEWDSPVRVMWSRPGMSAAVLPSSALKAQIALIQAAAALWMRMEAVRNTPRSWPPRVLSVCGSPADRLRIRADRKTDRRTLCVSVCARCGQSDLIRCTNDAENIRLAV